MAFDYSFAPGAGAPAGVWQPAPSVAPADRIFFPNLNGLRFLAAMLVIVSHVEHIRTTEGQSFWLTLAGVYNIGQIGVVLFFVLSGFLITYLLLAEKAVYGKINFRAFYLRRVVRIWPLYYVVVVLGLFVLPHIPFFADPTLTAVINDHLVGETVLHALMLPNAAYVLYPPVPYLVQAWSIGVEEQFYVIWPLVVHFSRRYFRNFALLAGGVYLAWQLSWFMTAPRRHMLPINEATTFVKNFLFYFRLQSMAIGGIFALVLFQKWATSLKILTARPVQVAVWVLLAVMIARGQMLSRVTFEVYSVLFGILVLNLALTESSIVSLRHPVLDYLGRISYGLYMLHFIAITVGIKAADALLRTRGAGHHLLTYAVTLAVAVALAATSYRFLEKPFLRLKKRFTRIQSGSAAT